MLVQSDYFIGDVDPARYVSLVADALLDVVLDITYSLRAPLDSPFPAMAPVIGPIHAGRNIDLVINDSTRGSDVPPIGSHLIQVNVVNPPDLVTLIVPPSGTYHTYFHPDAAVFVYNDPVLIAWGTEQHARRQRIRVPRPQRRQQHQRPPPVARHHDQLRGDDERRRDAVQHAVPGAVLLDDERRRRDLAAHQRVDHRPRDDRRPPGRHDHLHRGRRVARDGARTPRRSSTRAPSTTAPPACRGAAIILLAGLVSGRIGGTGATPDFLEIRSSLSARGSLWAAAAADVLIDQVAGTLYVDEAVSLDADVALRTRAGGIRADVDDGTRPGLRPRHRPHRRRRHHRRRQPGPPRGSGRRHSARRPPLRALDARDAVIFVPPTGVFVTEATDWLSCCGPRRPRAMCGSPCPSAWAAGREPDRAHRRRDDRRARHGRPRAASSPVAT